MRNKKVTLVFLLIALVIIAVSGYISFSQQFDSFERLTKNYPQQTQTLCESGGADWKQFGSGCHDECAVIRSTIAITCTDALSNGCDCGPAMCWNGNACEPN